MTAHLGAALDYAGRGWPVFPLHGIVRGRCTCGRDCGSPGKHPLVRRGLHEATTDVREIKEWWTRWRRANIAVVTGEPSGFVVVDIDLPRAVAPLDAVVHKLPRTLTGLTGGGGIHLLLRAPQDRSLHNHASRLPGTGGDLPGIDLRATGGYIVAPPSLHISGYRYEWLDPNIAIACVPEWLREQPRRPIAIGPPRFRDTDGTPEGKAALQRQLGILSSAREGERNHTLNRCAFIVGLFIRSGHLDETSSRAALENVGLSIGLADWETRRTVDSALSAT